MNSENVDSLNALESIASVSFLADLLSVASASLQTQSPDFSGLRADVSLTVGSDEDNVFFFVPQSSSTSALFSAGGDDVVYVGEGNNFVVAADITRQGQSERDYVNLGTGIDTVLLGDTLGSYYANDGWNDHLYVDGFEAGVDQLVLFGDRTQYQVQSTDQGAWLLLAEAGDTAIAYLNGVTQLDLSSDSFIYTNADAGDSDSGHEESGHEESGQSTPESVEIEPGTGRTREFYEKLGVPQFEDIAGSLANDQLIGGTGAQQLMGFGGNDYAVGGVGSDLFVLGDFGGSYYTQQGWQDSVYIEDFVVGVDQLQLQGSASQYSTTADRSGTWLYDSGDAVAYLKNVATIDLNSFKYLSL